MTASYNARATTYPNCVQMGMLREQMCRVNIRLIAVNEDVASGLEFDDELLFEQSSIRLFERQ